MTSRTVLKAAWQLTRLLTERKDSVKVRFQVGWERRDARFRSGHTNVGVLTDLQPWASSACRETEATGADEISQECV